MTTTHHWFGENFAEPESCFEVCEVDIWIKGDEVTVENDYIRSVFPLEKLEKFIATHKAEIARRSAV